MSAARIPPTITDETWIVSCPKCHRWRTLGETGGVRIGAKSSGKRVLSWCRRCRRLRWARLEQAREIPHDRLHAMAAAAPGD